MLKNFKFRGKLLNSFWIWFAGSIFVAQMGLLCLVLFVLLRPSAQSLAQVTVALSDAIAQIEEVEGQKGVDRLLKNTYNLDHFSMAVPLPPVLETNTWHPTLKVFNKAIHDLDKNLTVSYGRDPQPSAFFHRPGEQIALFRQAITEGLFARKYLFWSLIITFVLTIVAAYWIATRIANPLFELSTQARKLASGVDIKRIDVPQNSSPELRDLSESLNEMRAALDRSVSEREEFLAMVTHDLRTPLSRMALWLDTSDLNSPEVSLHLQDDIAEMRSFLEQYVELSKLNEEVDEAWSHGNLGDLLDTIKDRYQRAGNSIEVSKSGDLDFAFKPLAITRLLYNLTDNAIRYGTGSVHIEAVRNIGEIRLTVSNPVAVERNVLGIADAFKSSDKNMSNPAHGAGLGLKIVQQFAHVHRAKVLDDSKGSVRATTILFTA